MPPTSEATFNIEFGSAMDLAKLTGNRQPLFTCAKMRVISRARMTRFRLTGAFPRR